MPEREVRTTLRKVESKRAQRMRARLSASGTFVPPRPRKAHAHAKRCSFRRRSRRSTRSASDFPELAVGLVHGRLKGEEKAAVMSAFQRGEIQLLVATTVIEVGVDVPNATLMVIEHAERMGLSQLHQLRGRVGRGAGSSTCILLYQQPLTPTARERLKIIYENTDGFEVARHDLRLRGPGEMLGAKQSGVPMLRFADLSTDVDLLDAARDVADRLLRDNPAAAQAHLARWLGGRHELLEV